MNRSTWSAEEERLADALRVESQEAAPRPDGWGAIAARLAPDDLAVRREQRRHRRHGVVAAVVASGMVAATVVFALGGGLHREPPPTAPTAPASTPAGFDPSSPRTTWPVYRAGKDRLYADAVRATAPYDPAQPFAALFGERSAVVGPLGLEANGRNRVASLRSTPTALVLDLDAADTSGDGRSPRVVDLEAQAWVATANAAFDVSDVPLLVTLHGRPFRLFGVLDTTTPIAAADDVPVTHSHRIVLPETGARVTSPVSIVVDPGAGDYDYVVRDEASGTQVWSDSATRADDAGTLGFSAELPPGAYELVVRPGADRPTGSRRDLFQSDFVVTGPAPAPAQTPVTDPPTTDVPRVAVTWPERDGVRLVEEWRPRGTVAQVLADLGEGPARAGTPVVRPWRGTTLGSVSTRADRVVVDLPSAPALRAPDVATARRWTLTLVLAVDAVLQTDLPVQVTVAGGPTTLFGRLDTSRPLSRAGVVAVSPQADLFSPREGHWGSGEAVVVGSGPLGARTATWYVIDPVSNETRYQGRAPLDGERTYGFRLPLPAGDYLLEVHLDGAAGRTTFYDLRVL